MKMIKRSYNRKTDILMNFCKSITDCHHSSPVYINEGSIVIRNFNIKEGRLNLEKISYTNQETYEQRIGRSKPEAGDLIITREAPMGEICIIPKGIECCLGQRMVLIKPNYSKVDNKYLLYSLLSEYSQIQINKSEGTGSTVSNLRIPLLKELKIPVINLLEQKKIGNTLGGLDAKIELNNKINSELEAMAKMLYDYWFVQFDFPDSNGKPYKSSGGKMFYNKELKREIPEGWENGKFGDYAKAKGGFAFKSTWWTKAGLPVIKIKDINEDYTVTIEKCSCVSEDKYEKAKSYHAFPGDVVIAMTGATVGKYGIIPKNDKPILVNQRVALFNMGSKPIDKLPFLINSLNQDYFRETVFVLASGAAQPNISSDQIDGIPLIIPKPELVESFNKELSGFYQKIINHKSQNQQLASLRDWLLPMLMNGQVSVGDVHEELGPDNYREVAEPSEKYGK